MKKKKKIQKQVDRGRVYWFFTRDDNGTLILTSKCVDYSFLKRGYPRTGVYLFDSPMEAKIAYGIYDCPVK